jgi:hypothetical protein
MRLTKYVSPSPEWFVAVQAIQSSVAGLPGVDLNNPDVKNAINEAAKESKKDDSTK